MAEARLDKNKPRVTIGTIGHISHGKTTLTTAITKTLSKRDPRNWVRSFDSINTHGRFTNAVAQVAYETENRHYVHLDCPGHSDYIKNMLAAARMDGVILVVAATHGPTLQTREHIMLARRFGVPSIVVALNKVEMVDDPDLLDLVEREVRELLSSFQFPGDKVPLVRVSARGALSGGAKWEATVDELMAKMDAYIPLPEHDIDKPFLMPIESIFSIQGSGAAVAGRIEMGTCKVGDEMEIVGLTQTRKAVVTGVQVVQKLLDEGRAPHKVNLFLRDIEKNDVQPGQVIAEPGSIKPHKKCKADIYLFSMVESGRHILFHGDAPQFHFRAIDVRGRVILPDGIEMVIPGDRVATEIELTTPVALDKGLRFAIREAGRVIGVGVVLEV